MIDIDLPYLGEIFAALRAGRHLCLEDSLLYGALDSRFEEYQFLFSKLDIALERDKWGTIYFGSKTAPKAAEKIVYFMAIFVEWLDDKGLSVREAIKSRKIYAIADLPHVTASKYAELMEKVVDVKGASGMLSIVTSMARYGFVELLGTTEFRFRLPAHRLLDISGHAGRDAERQAADLAADGRAPRMESVPDLLGDDAIDEDA